MVDRLPVEKSTFMFDVGKGIELREEWPHELEMMYLLHVYICPLMRAVST